MKNQNLWRLAGRKMESLIVLSLLATQAVAFDSGSTGADGAFSPTSNTSIVLPANGIVNFTTMNIPSGVTVNISSNPANTAAVILVQGDAVIDGSINISGVDGESAGGRSAGGFAGGIPQAAKGGNGKGPGGGLGAGNSSSGGNGGAYSSQGTVGTSQSTSTLSQLYGSTSLQPLLGGSGGGSSVLTNTFPGYKGGGGGGALLLAVSGTLTLNGSILANGGSGAPSVLTISSNRGSGGGSGGGVRIIASTLTGTGTVNISGGRGGDVEVNASNTYDGGNGGNGRARLEADAFSFTGIVIPNIAATSAPQPVFASNLPTIRITTIAGTAVPANPIGENDVILPTSIANPVTIEFAATGVPLGSTIELTVSPTTGATTTTTSSVLAGTVASSTANVQVTLPAGASVLLASASFAVSNQTASLFAPFANGETVARVELKSMLGSGASSMKLITESGNVYEIPSGQAQL